MAGLPGLPGIGSQPGVIGGGEPGAGAPGGQAGGRADGQSGGQNDLPGGSGNYSLDNLPGSGDGGSAPLTAQERVAVLDGALNQGYEQFDGFILEERARAQAEANAARTGMPGNGGADSSGSDSGASPVIMAGRGGSAQGPQGAAGAGGGGGPEGTFPPPEDIPNGRDDDVVARQLREAAMREPDAQLREALWDEYRRYTGMATN